MNFVFPPEQLAQIPDVPPRHARPRPPVAALREKPPGAMATLFAAWTNPMRAATRAQFELPVVALKTVFGPLVFVADPSAIAHVLVHNTSNYHKDRYQRQIAAPVLRNGLLMVEDEQWRTQRHLLGPLFTPKTISGFSDAMGESACALVDRWRAHPDGHALDITAEMAWVSIDVLRRTIFTDGFCREPDEIAKAVWHYFNTMGRIDPLDVFHVPDWVPRWGRLRARSSLRFFSRMVDDMIEARRKRLADSRQLPPGDLLTLLLASRDQKTGDALSQAEIRDNISTFCATGFESTTNALTWALYLLSLDPEWHERLQHEVDRAMPGGHYVNGSWQRLINTRAVVEEAMRLYPPVPVMGRQAIGPDRVAGHDIAPGTLVIVAPGILHRHRLLWDDPDVFDPSRFLPGKREKIDRYAYLPFGAGPHICIGVHFSMQEIIIVLATILHSFRCEVAPGHHVWPLHRIGLRPRGGLPMILRRRARH